MNQSLFQLQSFRLADFAYGLVLVCFAVYVRIILSEL